MEPVKRKAYPRKSWIDVDMAALLRRFGLMQKELAEMLDVDKSTVYIWCRKNKMPKDKYGILIKRFGVTNTKDSLRRYVADLSGIRVAKAKPADCEPEIAFQRLTKYLGSREEAGYALAMWTLTEAVAEQRDPKPEERHRALTYLEWGGLPKRSILKPDEVPEELETAYRQALEQLRRIAENQDQMEAGASHE